VSDDARATARAWIAPAVAAGAVFALALATAGRELPGAFWDDGVYLASARSLAAGDGYRFAHLPGAPAAVHFPPLWPALLALALRVAPAWPATMGWLAIINPILLAATAALAVRWATRHLGLRAPLAAIVAVCATATLPLLVIAHTLFSEPLFLALLFVTLLATERAATRGGVRFGVAAGLAAGATVLARSAGIALVPAVVIALVVARRRRAAAAAAAAAIACITPWQLWSAAHAHELAPSLRGSYGPYLAWVLRLYRERGVGFAGTVAAQNVVSLFRTTGIVLFPFVPFAARPLLITLVIVVVAVGLIAARRRLALAATFLAGYLLMVLPWPYAPERFLWAVWPLIALVAARGAAECWHFATNAAERLPVRAANGLCAAVLLVALGGHGWYTARGLARHWWDSAAVHNAEALTPVAEWIRANTAPRDVVACDGEAWVYFATGRTVVPVHSLSPDEYLAGTPLEQAASDLRALIAENHPRWLVLSAAAGELAAVPLLDGREAGPGLRHVADLPGGGAAFAVIWDRPNDGPSELSSLDAGFPSGAGSGRPSPESSPPNARAR